MRRTEAQFSGPDPRQLMRGCRPTHRPYGLALSLLAEPRTHVVEAQRAEVAFLVAAQGDRAALGLAVSHHEHVGDLAQLRLADLAPDRLRPLVNVDAEARQRLLHLACV